MNPSTNNNNNNNAVFSPYLLSRFHQHLNHLNDMAFAHTKILQEIIEKRSVEPMTSSPRGSISSSSSSTSPSTTDSTQRKRSYPCSDNHESKHENHLNKRPRKQSKPQQLLKIDKNQNEQSASSDTDENDDDDEEEIGEVNEPNEKQDTLPIAAPPVLPFIPNNLPFLSYIQDLARANNVASPVSVGKFLENFQKELLSTSMDSKRMLPPPPPPPPPFFSQTVHHHHHPYFSQILLNNSFINHFPSSPSLNRFGHSPSDVFNDHSSFPYHLSTPKKRRTKVTDTRLSPRITSKIPADDLTDDENSSSQHSSDENPSKSDQQLLEYNGFQIILTSLHLRKAKLMFFYTRYPNSSVLKAYFPDVRFNKLITAQLVKWFSNFREFFYQQIEKYARQCLAEGISNVDDLIITPNSELYRILNLHYNRSNQINVPISFSSAVQAALREFFIAIQQQKDLESSWKKSIYKIMQRFDDQIPEFFKNDHWMHSI
ncbi:unnamed protein product [Rotaria socialis]|uniref:Prospero domain-containing protein n=4 Tax=Rotaria socialis TaxID=392032 RepID=A0A818A4J0_9BILA|nr:unnamed protein product [Rotaria socialis]CAF3421557.1 unnamed protein product [Rotaria socialis]CAF3666900.1 unnamed protein product [Rotaria socialis]